MGFLYSHIQSRKTNSHIFTLSHFHGADSAFSLQVHTNFKGHSDISLVLAHCLPAPFEKLYELSP